MEKHNKEIAIASPSLRLAAFIVEFLILMLIFLSLFGYIASQGSVAGLLDALLSIVISYFALALFAMPFYGFMISRLGGSFGKILTGTAIVGLDGENISFWRAIFRNYVGYTVSGLLFWLGFIWILVDERRQGWHDMVSETLVVKRNEAGKMLGIAAIVALLIVNYLVITNVASNISNNMHFYEITIEDAKSEVENLFENSPRPTSTMPTPLDMDIENRLNY